MITSHLPHHSIPTLESQHRRNVVVEALLEKLEKVAIAQMTLEHEYAQLKSHEDSLRHRMEQLKSETTELQRALNDYQASAGSVTSDETMLYLSQARANAEIAPTRPQSRMINVRRRLNPESHQRRTVVEMAGKILEVAGSMPTNSLYEILMGQGIDVPSKNRLSQILSEAPEFEADRINGWSLKSEKPGVR